MFYLKIFVIIIIFILIGFLLFNNLFKKKSNHHLLSSSDQNKRIIFTCTTFFDFKKQDKWISFCNGIDSILKLHDKQLITDKIDTWFVVNEYSDTYKQDWKKLVKERYPFIEFVQKDKSKKGQGTSLNMILEKIKGYKYWIHWEESWFCRKPCIDRMIDIIENTDVDQLQVTQRGPKPDWLDLSSDLHVHKKTNNGSDYIIILPNPDETIYKLDKQLGDPDYIGAWPYYSLRPSINKVDFYSKTGKFSEDPRFWPGTFEMDYARKCHLNKLVKAVLPDGPVYRDEKNHASTYS